MREKEYCFMLQIFVFLAMLSFCCNVFIFIYELTGFFEQLYDSSLQY